MAESKKRKLKKGHKSAFPVGMLVVLLAAVGIVTIVVSAVKGVGTLVENGKNFEEYNKLLTPVVLIDPDNFDDITKADMSDLIDISVWSLLKSDISPDKYESSENGMILPQSDVEEEFKKLFGTEITPVHATVDGYGYEFTYDANAKSYTVPLTGIVPIYTPQVVEKSESSDTVVLTVACLAGDGWQQAENGQMVAPEPDKYIKVTLREKDGNSYISAIQSTTAPETATTSAQPSETQSETTAPETEKVASETTAAAADASETTSA